MSSLAAWLREAAEEVLEICREVYPLGHTHDAYRFLRPGLPSREVTFADLPWADESLGPWTLTRRVWATPKGFQWAEARDTSTPVDLPHVVLRDVRADTLFMPVELVDLRRALWHDGYRGVWVESVRGLSREDLHSVRGVFDLSGSSAAVHALKALGVSPQAGDTEQFWWR